MNTLKSYKTMHARFPKIPLTAPRRRSANTIYSNSANGTNSAGGIEDSSPTAFYNNILYANSGDELKNSPGITHSFIDVPSDSNDPNQDPAKVNIGPFTGDNDPKFAGTNPANLETFLHLASDSPCIDAENEDVNGVRYRDFDSQLGPLDGDDDGVPPDERDMGADEYPTPDASFFSFWWENF